MTLFARSCLALALLLAAPHAASSGETEVDLALVLAVDISNSMDPEEQELQRQGFVEAFRSPVVHDAIRKGMLGRVAVVYFEWAGVNNQQITVPWTVMEGPAEATGFADRLATVPTRRGPRTSISGALDYAVGLLARSGVEAMREVIDVSGDGANNQGRLVTEARDDALARGVTINGLPIMLKRGGGVWDTADLDRYYRDCVIGGPGAFLVPVRERSQFVEAIKTKVIREIAAKPGLKPIPAQAESQANCLVGANWDRY